MIPIITFHDLEEEEEEEVEEQEVGAGDQIVVECQLSIAS